MEQTQKSNKGIWIAVGIVAVICLCAAVAAIVVFARIGSAVKESVKVDPQKASEAGHQIADYDLPPGYHEQMSMDVFTYTFVIITPGTMGSSSANSPLIMLAQFSNVGNYDQKQMEEQMRKSLEQQSGQRGQDLKTVKEEKMTLRGQETTVTTREGSDQNGNLFRQVSAIFPGKKGIAMLFVQGQPDHWDEHTINNFIKSIR